MSLTDWLLVLAVAFPAFIMVTWLGLVRRELKREGEKEKRE
jgi:hypothetical protein